MTDGPLLLVDDLRVTYHARSGDLPAVRGVSFELERGASLGLAGESGCGKSTMANAILRLLPAGTTVDGSVLLHGHDVLAMKPGALRAVRWTEGAIVFQGALHALNPVQRIGAQISEPMLLHRTQPSKRAAATRVAELLEQVGLPGDRASAYPHQLSGGQRQRVLIAMALACDPSLLIADEPTTALDVMVQAQVLALLARLRVERGLSMIFITHDLSVLTDVCDDLAVMYAGRIVEEGRSGELFHSPRHPYTSGLAAAFPTIGDPASRMNPSGLGGDPPDPAHLPTGCPFHPRCVLAEDRCRAHAPELSPAGDARRAACLLVEDPT
ncbi:MAG: ABC transporter ATP-binding protein [Ilumatobacter fluminis]|uniref:ABC transporter ATP-binding protein n=1 Tax=Ilumatobacter fluminis TaxID=467091 RepID=UPI0032ECE78E